MGCYINPPTGTKEDFLARNGLPVPALSWENKPIDSLPVVLFYNQMFTAAGIAFSAKELQEFTLSDDYRRKDFYYVPITKLMEVSNIQDYLEKEN